MWYLLWLLLPIAALTGWWGGYRSAAKQTSQTQEPLSREYFQGLNYLLNEQPDRAIEVFTRMAETDEDTVETHLTLGNLFRRRGEAERAVRIHQNLMARPSLAPAQRAAALMELARDYMAAGLLDRAEALFTEALEFTDYRNEALRTLVDIYQQEKEWESAINTAQQLQKASGQDYGSIMAQFACEQADTHVRSQADAGVVRHAIRRALRFDSNCVRASLLRADLEHAQGRWRAAIKACQQIEKQDIDYIPEALERLESNYHALGEREAFMAELYRLLNRYPGVSVLMKLGELIDEQQGRKAAIEFLATQLRERPSVRGLDQLIALNISKDDTDPRRQRDLKVLRELFAALLGDRLPYRCVECGFEGRQLHWQCPGCRTWATMKPQRGLQGE